MSIYELPTYWDVNNEDRTHGPNYRPGDVLLIDDRRAVVLRTEKEYRTDRTPAGYYRKVLVEYLKSPPEMETYISFMLYEKINGYGEYAR